MKRKNGEGTWGKKTIHGIELVYFRDSKQNYTYGKTTKAVKEKLKQKSLSLKNAKIDTFKSYGLNWLRTVKALELEARTYDEYENIIEKRIGNHSIGSRQLHSITSDTWQSYINELSGKYALGTIKKTWNVIKQIVTYAEAKGDIHEGTLKLVRLPKESNVAVKAKEIPFIDEVDMNILYNEAFHTIGTNNRCMYGNASKLLVLIMYTGLRVFGIFDKSKNGIIEDFYRLKQLYDKTDGLQLKHLILSWGTRPDIPRKKLRKLIKQTMGFWGKDYQLVYAIHEDRQPNKWHAHIVMNSVSNTGRKIQITRSTLTKFKRKFNNIWNPYGYELHMEENNQNTGTDKSFECDNQSQGNVLDCN